MNFKHTGLFPEQAANWDFAQEQIAQRRAADQGAEPVRLHRRRHGGLRRGRGSGVPCGRGQGHGGLGQGERPAAPAWRTPRSAGSWTTAPSSWSGRSAGAGATMPSSWIRPPMAAALPARCGSWRRTSIPSWSWCAEVLSRSARCSSSSTPTPPVWPPRCWAICWTLLVTKKYGGHTECQELGLPVTASGLALPCGATRALDGRSGQEEDADTMAEQIIKAENVSFAYTGAEGVAPLVLNGVNAGH